MKRVLLLLAILAIAVPFYFRKIDGRVPLNSDEARYILFASSLAELKGYGISSPAGFEPHGKLPPAFPALLAPVALVAGQNFSAMRALVLALGLASAVFVFLLFSKTNGIAMAAVVAALILFSPFTLAYSASIMSEVPYLFSSVLALYFARGWDNCDKITSRSSSPAFALTFVASFTRAVGIALLAGLLLRFLSREVRSKMSAGAIKGVALVFVFFLVLWALWLARSTWLSSPEGYGGEFFLKDPYDHDLGAIGVLGLIQRARQNLVDYAYVASRCAFGDADFSRARLAAAAMAALVTVGFVSKLAGQRGAAEYYFGFYAVGLLLWPWSGIRFALPILPMIFYYLLWGLKTTVFFFARRGAVRQKLAKAILLCFAAFMLYSNANGFMGAWRRSEPDGAIFGQSKKTIADMARWVRDNSRPQSVIMAENPPLVTLISNRKAVIYPFTKDVNALMEAIARAGVDYVMVEAFTGGERKYATTPNYLLPALMAYKEKFQLAQKGEDWAIYKVIDNLRPLQNALF